MRASFLPYNLPEVGEEEVEAVAAAIRSRWITRGPETARLEAELSSYLDGAAVVAVSSCTAALHLALVGLTLQPGDEVITTPYTFAASVNAIIHAGGTPVLVDIDARTGNISPSAVAAAVTERTRAILPVHFAGHPVDLAALQAIAERHGLALVEDAAHAIGARYRGRPVGSHGNLTAFSFYATKNLTTGEGGALVVPDPAMEERIRVLSLHGLSRHAWNRYAAGGSWAYAVEGAGFKYNLTDIAAAMGRVQLRKLPTMQARRAALAARYLERLASLPVELPTVAPEVEHAWHLFPLRLKGTGDVAAYRARVVEGLRRQNIGTSVHFIPIHLHRYYQERFGWRPGMFPVAEAFFAGEISLPLYPGMTDNDVDDVVAALSDVLRQEGGGSGAGT